MRSHEIFSFFLSVLFFASHASSNPTQNITETEILRIKEVDKSIELNKPQEAKTLNQSNNASQINATVQNTKDIFILEIEHLKEQISLTERKIYLINQLREYYLENNLIIPPSNIALLDQITSGELAKNLINTFPSQNPQETNDLNLMSKIFKKETISFPYTIKQFMFLPTKSLQRAPDEPANTAVFAFLFSNNEIGLYSLNGILLLTFTPGHDVKLFTVNSFTDEYFVVTLGRDNTVRLHNITTIRAGQKPTQGQESSTEKNKRYDKAKFITEFNYSLEYIFDLETKKIITEEVFLLQTSRKEKNYRSISSIQGRALKFIAVVGEDGDLLLINRNGTYKGSFTFPDSKLLSIQKHHPHPIYITEKNVGFFNPIQMDIASPHCDLPGEYIQKIEVNQFATNEFFLLLKSGDILFYEIKQSTTHCKAIAKRTFPFRSPKLAGYDIFSAKDFLLIKDSPDSPHIFAHNITDVIFANIQDIEYLNLSFYPHQTGRNEIVKHDYITLRTSFSSSVIGAYYEFANGTSIFARYELIILAKPVNDWMTNFRIPIVFVAVVLAIGYQFWNRRKKRDDTEVMETLSKFNIKEALGGKSGNAKDFASLKESIDSLSKQTSRLQDDLGNVTKKTLSSLGLKNKNLDDDEGLQEISTKKYI